jgi:membrane protein DedA with SNARE-associated domain
MEQSQAGASPDAVRRAVVESFLIQAGYGALILLAFLQGCCIPIPSEITFGFAGVLAYQGRLNLALVIVLGTLAELAGSFVSYAAGRVIDRPVIERFSRYVLITKSDLDRAERFLAGHGAWAIPLGRMLPLVRAFTSLVAGFAGVPALRFGVLCLIGTVAYVASVTAVGYGVGSAWNRVTHAVSQAGYVAAAVVAVAVVAFVIVRLRKLRRESRESGSAPEREEAAPRPVGERAPRR